MFFSKAKSTVLLAAILLLVGCATNKASSNNIVRPSSSEANSNDRSASSRVNSAAKTIIEQPFRDLGFMKKEIPPALAQIADPYATPEGMDCAWISYQISQLDIVLPHEAVRSASFDDRSQSEKNAEAVSKATESAMDEAVRSTANDIMPGRSIIRRLSGAEKSDSEYNKAIERGKIRRGYLRGLSFAKNCPNR